MARLLSANFWCDESLPLNAFKMVFSSIDSETRGHAPPLPPVDERKLEVLLVGVLSCTRLICGGERECVD
jgi:hypothetical protein